MYKGILYFAVFSIGLLASVVGSGAGTIQPFFETLQSDDPELVDGTDASSFSTTNLTWGGTTPAEEASLTLDAVSIFGQIPNPSFQALTTFIFDGDTDFQVLLDLGDPAAGLKANQSVTGTLLQLFRFAGSGLLILSYQDGTRVQSADDVQFAFGSSGGSATFAGETDPTLAGLFFVESNEDPSGENTLAFFSESDDPSRVVTNVAFLTFEDKTGGELIVARQITTTPIPLPAGLPMIVTGIVVLRLLRRGAK